MCVWGQYPRAQSRPHVYISRHATVAPVAVAGSPAQTAVVAGAPATSAPGLRRFSLLCIARASERWLVPRRLVGPLQVELRGEFGCRIDLRGTEAASRDRG